MDVYKLISADYFIFKLLFCHKFITYLWQNLCYGRPKAENSRSSRE